MAGPRLLVTRTVSPPLSLYRVWLPVSVEEGSAHYPHVLSADVDCSFLPTVKYYSSQTQTAIIRTSRDHYRIVQAALACLGPVNNERVIANVLHISGACFLSLVTGGAS